MHSVVAVFTAAFSSLVAVALVELEKSHKPAWAATASFVLVLKRLLTKLTAFFPVASQRTPFTHFSMGRHANPMPAAVDTQDGIGQMLKLNAMPNLTPGDALLMTPGRTEKRTKSAGLNMTTFATMASPILYWLIKLSVYMVSRYTSAAEGEILLRRHAGQFLTQ